MKKAVVLGFYDRGNLGDESYKLAFRTLLGGSWNLAFYCMDDIMRLPEDTDMVICGGGDIINDYFMKKAMQLLKDFVGPVYAVSVGIPYESGAHYLDMFDHVFVRSTKDYEIACRRVGEPNVSLIPDVVCIMRDRMLGRDSAGVGNKMHVHLGMCLAQPVFADNTRDDVLLELCDGVKGGVDALKRQGKMVTLHVLAFNTNARNERECDYNINQHICKLLLERQLGCKIVYHKNKSGTMDMLSFFKNRLDACICMRYHSIIYSLICDIPFFALYESPKVSNIVADLKMRGQLGVTAARLAEFVGGDLAQWCETTAFGRRSWGGNGVAEFAGVVEKIREQKRKLVSKRILLGGAHKRMSTYEDIEHECIDNIETYLGTGKPSVRAVAYTKINLLAYLGIPKDSKEAENLARYICFLISGSVEDPCLWGLKQNMDTDDFCLHDALYYIWNANKNQTDECQEYFLEYKGQKRCFFHLDSHISNSHIFGVHRSGWEYVLNGLYNFEAKAQCKRGKVYIDSYVDRTFHWCSDIMHHCGVIPYKMDWIGFIHHTFDVSHSSFNCVELFENPLFLESLKTCKGLIVLSSYLRGQVVDALERRGFGNIHVYVVWHPMEFVKDVFTVEKFYNNKEKGIVNIGAWLRNPYKIYELDISNSTFLKKKMTLRGRNMNLYFPPNEYTTVLKHIDHLFDMDMTAIENGMSRGKSYDANKFLQSVGSLLQSQLKSVEVTEHLNNTGYDTLLSENIVFLNLVDCSAVNTVLECIVRHTPLIVNRHPALEEYLGQGYPGFYTTLKEAEEMCGNMSRILRIHEYLRRLDKSKFTLATFLNMVQDIVVHSCDIACKEGDWDTFRDAYATVMQEDAIKTKVADLIDVGKFLPSWRRAQGV